MRSQAKSGAKRLQYDDYGKQVGTLVRSPSNQWVFLLEPGYMFVKSEETGRIRIWDNERMRLVDIAKDEQRNDD